MLQLRAFHLALIWSHWSNQGALSNKFWIPNSKLANKHLLWPVCAPCSNFELQKIKYFWRSWSICSNRLSKLTLPVLSAVVWPGNLLILRWIKIKSAYTGLMKPNIYSNPCQKEKPPTPRKSTLLFGENSFVAEEGMGFSPRLFSDSENNKSNSATVYYFCSSVEPSPP